MTTEILLSIAAVLGGFTLLVYGADRFVHGAAAMANNLGVSPLIIGLTVVGIGTSAPEILVSSMAAFQGNPALGVGNAVGSNIANIALVLGVTAIIAPLMVRSETLRREYPLMFAVMLVAYFLLIDGVLGFWDGIILVGGMFAVIGWMISVGLRPDHDPLEAEFESEIPTLSTGMSIFWLILGMALLLGSSRMLVWGSINIAQALGISDLVIGLTVVAIGTSLPELAASIVSALRREHDIAIGNIIGSNMFNLLAVLGLPGIIHPGPIDNDVITRDFPVMIGLSIAMFIMAYGIKRQGRINRFEGGLLLAAYIAYMVTLYYSVQS